MQHGRTQRGFTLVELMIVVAIIGVLSFVLFGTGSNRLGGGNPQTIAAQTVSALNMARTRAVATRRIHRVEIKADGLYMWASTKTGFVMPTSSAEWAFVQRYSIPNNVKIWSATTGTITTTGANPAQGSGLPYFMDYKPDGSATGGTIYVGGEGTTTRNYRVLTYKATGSSYARQTW